MSAGPVTSAGSAARPTGRLVADLEALGVRLWHEEGRLRYRAPAGVMTAERLATLREHKAELVEHLSRPAAGAVVPAQQQDRHEPFPLTEVQSAYLLGRGDAFGYGGVACHGYLEIAVPDLDPERLDVAWQRVVARHDMLRAVVHLDGRQQVLPEVTPQPISVTDLRGCSADEVEQGLARTRDELAHCVRPTDQLPLVELRLTRGDEHDVLHLSVDLLVADYLSVQRVLAELDTFYRAPDTVLPPLELTFRDYVLAANAGQEPGTPGGSRRERDREYWWPRIDELPAGPDLPLRTEVLHDDPLPVVSGAPPRFQRHRTTLDPSRWAAFRDRAAQEGLTPSGALLAAYAEVIAVWSREPRFTLNLTVLDRRPLHRQVNQVVGDFTSLSLLEVDGVGRTLADRARTLQDRLLTDLDHRTYSGMEVLRELARRRGHDAAMMPVVFTSAVGVAGDDLATGPGGLLDGELGYGLSQTPQVWVDCQVMEWRGSLSVTWDVRCDVFPDGMIADAFAAFATLLERLAAGTCWSDAYPVAVPEAHRLRRAAVNDTAGPLPDALLHGPVVARCLRDPTRPAVITPERTVRYAELLTAAGTVAQRLRASGSADGEIVALVMDKGVEQVVGVLAALLAGAVYLPIEADLPQHRRDLLLADAGVQRVLTQSWQPAGWPDGVDVTAVDAVEPDPGLAPPAPGQVGPDDPAYVIYTSGSTGRPKGVVTSHRAAANTVEDINRRFQVGRTDRVLGLANLGFDLSVFDVFGLLSVGGAVVLPQPDRRADPSHWAQLVAEYGVTIWNSVPAQMQMLEHLLASAPAVELFTLRLVLLSGDWIPVGQPDAIRRRLPLVDVVGLGGATEAAIWSIVHPVDEVRHGWHSIPYGRPLTNQTVQVLDKDLRPRPDWVAGEIHLGGAGLALGYLGDEARTAERFVRHPDTGERLYRTGDFGRALPSGEVEFLGRTDSQVKIRGYRVELAEIESVLQTHPAVSTVVVLTEGDEPLHRRIAAFVVPAAGASVQLDDLVDHLAARLPAHMVPAHLELLAELPLTANGKLDRSALRTQLPSPAEERPERSNEPVDDLEARLLGLWGEALGRGDLGRSDDFFVAGGDSLLLARLVGQMTRREPRAAAHEFGVLLGQVLRRPTVAALATFLRTVADEPTEPGAPAAVSPLVTLAEAAAPEQQAALAPAVLVHEATGSLAPYRDLVALLSAADPARTVLGLEARQGGPYSSADPAVLIERQAQDYVAALSEANLDRVHLVGYCVGGFVATELAKLLAESGSVVETLTVISPYRMPYDIEDALLMEYAFVWVLGIEPGALGLPVWDDVARAMRAVLARTPGRIADGAIAALDGELAPVAEAFRRFGRRPRTERLATVVAAQPAGGFAVDHDYVETLYDVFARNIAAITRYRAEPYAGDMTLIQASESDSLLPAEEEDVRYWQDVCLGNLTVLDIPGDHSTCMTSPNVAAIARVLLDSWERR